MEAVANLLKVGLGRESGGELRGHAMFATHILPLLILGTGLYLLDSRYRARISFLEAIGQRDNNEDTGNSFESLELRDVQKLLESDASTFECPTLEHLTQVPNDCRPKYPAVYNSSLLPIHSPGGPGPSTQTNGFRHVLLGWAKGRKFKNH